MLTLDELSPSDDLWYLVWVTAAQGLAHARKGQRPIKPFTVTEDKLGFHRRNVGSIVAGRRWLADKTDQWRVALVYEMQDGVLAIEAQDASDHVAMRFTNRFQRQGVFRRPSREPNPDLGEAIPRLIKPRRPRFAAQPT